MRAKIPRARDNKGKKFDLIVIGTGTAASTAAYKCRSAGWKVAVIDSRPFGGTCVLRGCDPKKVLVGAAEIIDMNQRMKGKGIKVNGNASLNWKDLMRFKRSFTELVPKEEENSFKKSGIATFHGKAKFAGKTTVKIDDKLLTGRHVMIATGAQPMKLNILGEEYLTTSDQFLELNKLPNSIVFVGGGYISFEFAHIAARAGVKEITIIHRGKSPLEKFDPQLVNMLVDRTRNLGIDILTQTEVKSITRKKLPKNAEKFVINVENGKRQRSIVAHMVVHGAGRNPEIKDLELEKAQIKYEKNGISVNNHLQSISNPAIYAGGDCASRGFPLTPIANYDGQIIADNLLGKNKTVNYKGTPSVVFTIPPLALVGLSEKDAKEMGLKFKTKYTDTSKWYSSRRINESHSGFKILVENNTDKILGVHLFGPHADEIINIFAMAIRLELKVSDLRKSIWSYPTNASDISYML